jgi:hypothetical protein
MARMKDPPELTHRNALVDGGQIKVDLPLGGYAQGNGC